MGASYIEHQFSGKKTKEQVISEMDCLQDAALRDHGSSYSGDLGSAPSGVVFVDKTFVDEDEASNWVIDNHQKWSRPMAVRYKVPAGGKKLESLEKKLNELREKKHKLMPWRTATTTIGTRVVQRISTQSAKYKSCNDCGSKVSSKHIKEVFSGKCPVCDSKTGFFTGGDFKALETLKKKVDKIHTDIDNTNEQIQQLSSQSNESNWLVGCWCSA